MQEERLSSVVGYKELRKHLDKGLRYGYVVATNLIIQLLLRRSFCGVLLHAACPIPITQLLGLMYLYLIFDFSDMALNFTLAH